MPKLPKITSLLFLLQYLKKEVRDKVDFVHADKHERFLQIDTMIFDGDDQAFQSSQNSKFNVFTNLKKEVRGEVDFLHADKHQIFLQIDAIIFGVCGQACPNYPKQQVCYFFAMS